MLFFLLLLLSFTSSVFGIDRDQMHSTKYPNETDFDRDGGRALGYLPRCPTFKNAVSISKSYIDKRIKLFFQTKSSDGGIIRKNYIYQNAAKLISKNFSMALKKKKTLIFLSGWLDSTDLTFIGTVVANSFSNIGYNVIVIDTIAISAFPYHWAASFGMKAGKSVARFIREVEGLKPQHVLMMGFSLGAQIMGLTGQEYFKQTRKRIGEMIALDPAGPCFRRVTPEHRLSPDDADFVQVIHTNMDGLGIADALGDVDFYVNGGEFQFATLIVLPCTGICSHVRAYELLNAMIAFPDQFIGVKCNNVQQAREFSCYENTPVVTNVMGLRVDRKKRGVFFLPTSHKWPFHLGMKGVTQRFDHLNEYLTFQTKARSIELNQDFWDRTKALIDF